MRIRPIHIIITTYSHGTTLQRAEHGETRQRVTCVHDDNTRAVTVVVRIVRVCRLQFVGVGEKRAIFFITL